MHESIFLSKVLTDDRAHEENQIEKLNALRKNIEMKK